MTKFMTDQEVNQKSIELAQVVCELEECLMRKKNFNANVAKEIRSCKDRMTELAQELNADEISKSAEDPTVGLAEETPVQVNS